MSYCKFGPDSDVYVYSSMIAPGDVPAWTLMSSAHQHPEIHLSRQAVLDRLLTLRSEGKRVPDAALERLRGEIKNEKA